MSSCLLYNVFGISLNLFGLGSAWPLRFSVFICVHVQKLYYSWLVFCETKYAKLLWFCLLSREYFSCHSLQLFWIGLIFLELELEPTQHLTSMVCASGSCFAPALWKRLAFSQLCLLGGMYVHLGHSYTHLPVSFSCFQLLISQKFFLLLPEGLESVLHVFLYFLPVFRGTSFSMWTEPVNFELMHLSFCKVFPHFATLSLKETHNQFPENSSKILLLN